MMAITVMALTVPVVVTVAAMVVETVAVVEMVVEIWMMATTKLAAWKPTLLFSSLLW